jgi:hypothetical protein
MLFYKLWQTCLKSKGLLLLQIIAVKPAQFPFSSFRPEAFEVLACMDNVSGGLSAI